MKKRICALLLCMLALLSAVASAEITVNRRDLNLNQDLERNVSNILVLMQDGDVTDTLMIASINSRTGRSVMTRIDCNLMVDIPEAGETALRDLYVLGDAKSRGLLVARTLNTLLGLNVSTYVALDITTLPTLVDAVDSLHMQLDAQEAQAMGTWEGINELTGDAVLDYVRLKLEGDSPARSRGYDAAMQLLYQGLHSESIMGMMGLGGKLLSAMDTNLNVMTAMTLVSAVQAGEDRRELLLPESAQILTESPLTADAQAMRDAFYEVIYGE